VSRAAETPSTLSAIDAAAERRERWLEPLIDRLPRGLQSTVRWLRRPSSRWMRIPRGILLIGGSLLSFLPNAAAWPDAASRGHPAAAAGA